MYLRSEILEVLSKHDGCCLDNEEEVDKVVDALLERFQGFAHEMIPISENSRALLTKLTKMGIYGRTEDEVIARFVDQRLIDLTIKEPFTWEDDE